ncbi:MAG: hypothetical protein KUA35_09635 [Pseudodesulfovibrio sp.]|uniref:Lipoprotein n=1 Tax=Pseudodesulfovibrio aespoeensis (strain ATCC 700646 / DSM 10631 / Aspo-2) TaxID=643562 RepID=E6VWG5_PSEA9|nr:MULTISPECIES: hypothetical protein [Pseudodesulfovibrio]MBU4193073.1 hypothetical protein [Pseudomonadota bacterium]ADU61371.1 hypothetical protein Daes_0346 [Pseudodesulfovibrio aespoeensis Aspo-2]MBU4242981.1 hypothetical protein [Pseudomonadota bacterium]MBU4378526.1 hypothetical protein [Pseudomonadota bacterium]MBU4474764.1 hypothetical protein [Pseudomonadota bacterium]
MLPTRILITALALLCLAGASLAGDYAVVDPPDSFRGFKWGTPLADIPDLKPIPKTNYKNTYYREDERLTFGDAQILSVAYYFRKDRLYRVGVAFEGRANHFLIKERLLGLYGQGRGVGQRYGWMWPDFSVELTYDDDAKSGALYYTFEGEAD